MLKFTKIQSHKEQKINFDGSHQDLVQKKKPTSPYK